jgi:two-component sensor histidine kinase
MEPDERQAFPKRQLLRLGQRGVIPQDIRQPELCTNAMKYGALSVPEGHVDLHWSVPEGDPGSLEIVWRERGGPPVLPATNRGFGCA